MEYKTSKSTSWYGNLFSHVANGVMIVVLILLLLMLFLAVSLILGYRAD